MNASRAWVLNGPNFLFSYILGLQPAQAAMVFKALTRLREQLNGLDFCRTLTTTYGCTGLLELDECAGYSTDRGMLEALI